MLIFTNKCLVASDNLLLRLMFIVLGSMEIIAQLSVLCNSGRISIDNTASGIGKAGYNKDLNRDEDVSSQGEREREGEQEMISLLKQEVPSTCCLRN